MHVTVYTKPHCPQCDATKRQFNKCGIDYTTVDITQDAAALRKLQDAGFMQAPVVITDSDSWSGYRPDKIRGLEAASVVKAAPIHAVRAE